MGDAKQKYGFEEAPAREANLMFDKGFGSSIRGGLSGSRLSSARNSQEEPEQIKDHLQNHPSSEENSNSSSSGRDLNGNNAKKRFRRRSVNALNLGLKTQLSKNHTQRMQQKQQSVGAKKLR